MDGSIVAGTCPDDKSLYPVAANLSRKYPEHVRYSPSVPPPGVVADLQLKCGLATATLESILDHSFR